MAAAPAEQAYYTLQQTLARQAAAQAERAWLALDLANITGSWLAGSGPLAQQSVIAGQLLAASVAQGYVGTVVSEQGVTPDIAGALVPTSFAGVASDGRPLDSLLYLPVIDVKVQIAQGVPVNDAMLSGRAQFVRMVATQVQDAGRVATGVAITADRAVKGHTRHLNPPSCGRCAILAGRFYRWSSGFRRHPGCDCTMSPATEDRGGGFSPQSYFDGLAAPEQERLFGKADAQAIRDGADMGRVVNAERTTYTAGGIDYTSEIGGSRLTPEAIYKQAAGNRDDALSLLKQHRYIS